MSIQGKPRIHCRHIGKALAGIKAGSISGVFPSLTIPACQLVALVNRTIDSGNGDPVTGFNPIYQSINHAWKDQACGGCYIQPEPALAFDGTWMAATYHPFLQNVNITLEFTGVAIWVFFILANKNNHGPGTTTNTQCNFTLDGQYTGFFSHDPDMSTYDQNYNVTVFSKTDLSNTAHQLIIAANDYPISTFINFDYAIYMVELPDPPTKSPSSQSPATTTTSSSMSSTSSSSTVTLSTSSITSQSFTTSTSSTLEVSSTTFPSQPSSSSVIVLSKASPARTGLIIGSVIAGLALTAVLLLACYRHRSRQMMMQRESTPVRFLDIARTRRHSSATDDLGAPFPHRTSQNVAIARISRQSQYRRIVKTRAMRQMQISEQIRDAQCQMDGLMFPESATSTSSAADATEHEISRLRDQVQELRNVIESLQRQQHSDWALGLTDEEPPPAYYSHLHLPTGSR